MDREKILKDINDIFKNVMENDSLVIVDSTNSSDIEEWDSLNNIQLIVALENHFKLKFKSFEIFEWKNVGEMCDTIERDLNL